ncbi:ATP-binding protein [Pseudoduganella sp. SL102]|uniref:ATP-binding protein n=1 Tax=Pseudoduganella sp. SL102 TaxID=2995154 RepID=UPI00248CCE13|nr:ATP-binding protein [Pseudoduganella sp. SL102]WBS04872.1 ATP-binding protein [Pseudoduganella sp. SL102]
MSALPPAPAEARAPRTVEETGLPFLFLAELVAKVLHQRGQLRLPELASHLKLGVGVIDPLMHFLRAEKLCEVARNGNSGTDADISYLLTEGGRQRAAAALGRNAYAGPAPVTLAAYTTQVQAQSVAGVQVTRAHMAAAFDGIVANQRVLAQLGSAMNSGRALFLHGQAGSGKTYLAERLRDLLTGTIAVPYALMVDGETIPFFDSVQHLPAADAVAASTGIDRGTAPDARWVRGVRRPAALAGGELTLDMLDLRFDAHTRLYQAPPHLKSNNGIFIIDDLGRQRCSPEALMNRWIVPMDRNVDYLTLHTGHTFQVPFDVIVVFSSNFVPHRLSDGAFLRRLGYKIEVPPASSDEYALLFRQACAQAGIEADGERFADTFAYLLECHRQRGVPLLACYPRDLVRQLRDLARYEDRTPELSRHTVDWAWDNYFAAGSQQGCALELERRDRGTQDNRLEND